MVAAATEITGNRPAPVLKFVGGKRKLLPEILPRLLTGLPPGPIAGCYCEPFLGGGAVFFELSALNRVREASLGDMNEDLMRTYLAIQRSPEALVAELRLRRSDEDDDLFYCYDEKSYYRIRALDPNGLLPLETAARMIYLNKCGFNGLYRVNKSGKFNVPFGRYTNPTICDEREVRDLYGFRSLHR